MSQLELPRVLEYYSSGKLFEYFFRVYSKLSISCDLLPFPPPVIVSSHVVGSDYGYNPG